MMRRFVAVLAILAFTTCLMLTVAHAQVKPGWPKSITIGAAPVGGTYFIWGGGFAKLVNDKVGVPGNVEVTGGPVHNTQLTQAGKLDFGMVTAGPLFEGFTGDPDGWAKGRKHPDLRVIFPMYTTYFQMYSLTSTGIKSIKDLNGKSVGVGPIGGTPATYWPKILAIGGITPKRIVNAGSSDLNSQLKDGMLDANGQATGAPWVTITEVQTTNDVNAYGVPEDIAKKAADKYPSMTVGSIPKGMYNSNKDHDITTLEMFNYMIVHKDAPADFVYEVVKATFANKDILIAAHKSAKEVDPAKIVTSPIPLHPGALKYYQEIGIKIPERLIAK